MQVTSYVNIWVPLFEGAKAAGIAPDVLLHWGHGGAMATVLFLMGGYGAFLGWQTRFGNGGEVYALSLGETARELHPRSWAPPSFSSSSAGRAASSCWPPPASPSSPRPTPRPGYWGQPES